MEKTTAAEQAMKKKADGDKSSAQAMEKAPAAEQIMKKRALRIQPWTECMDTHLKKELTEQKK